METAKGEKESNPTILNSAMPRISKFILLSGPFFFGIFICSLVWNNIRLPFHNPWGIVGVLANAHYNPANNLVRYIVFIACPVCALTATYLFNIPWLNKLCFGTDSAACEGPADAPRARNASLIAAFFMLFAVAVSLNYATYHSQGGFDVFHEGESLGSGVSVMKGKVPYKDIVLVHGMYEDPLRAIVAFKLFGRSIASVRTLQSAHKVIVFILLAFFLLRLFNAHFASCFLFMIILFPPFMPSLYVSFPAYYKGYVTPLIPARDMVTFSFLIACTYLYPYIKGQKADGRFFAAVFAFAFIGPASCAYSLDRGLYLTAAYCLLAPLLLLSFSARGYRAPFFLASCLGIGCAVTLLGVLLKGHFWEFFQFTFAIMPRYKELMDGFIYPVRTLPFFAMITLIAFNTYWVAFRFIQALYAHHNNIIAAVKPFVCRFFLEICLLLVGILFFRSALGRADREHLMYVALPVYTLTLYIVMRHWLHKIIFRKAVAYTVGVIAAAVFLSFVSAVFKERLIRENFPLGADDARFIPGNHRKALAFLKGNLQRDEEFFSFTPEASWYYFLDKACPTRFPVVTLAGPSFYQDEIVHDLKRKNVKFILFRNGSSDYVDRIPVEVRLKRVADYIREDYRFLTKIDDNEIYGKK